MLLRRRLRWSRRAGSYLDGEQGKSKAVVLEEERKQGSRGDDGNLPGRFMAGGGRETGRCAVHTFVHHERFAFGFEGECASVLVQGEALQSTHAAGL